MAIRNRAAPANTLTRRKVLGLAAWAAASLALKSSRSRYTTFSNEVADIMDFPRHRYDRQAPVVLPSSDQLAVDTNRRLASGLGRHSRAYGAVHSGFLETQIQDLADDFGDRLGAIDPEWFTVEEDKEFLRTFADMQDGAQGDYGQYLARLTRLYGALQRTNVPVLCFVEARDIYNGTIPRPELRPPANALLMVTHRASSDLVPEVRCRQPDGAIRTMPQRPELVYDALRKAGVEELWVAGEYGASPWGGFPACLGTTAQDLQQEGFRVHGIEGAVFPSQPADRILPDLINMLHTDVIPFEQAIQP